MAQAQIRAVRRARVGVPDFSQAIVERSVLLSDAKPICGGSLTILERWLKEERGKEIVQPGKCSTRISRIRAN